MKNIRRIETLKRITAIILVILMFVNCMIVNATSSTITNQNEDDIVEVKDENIVSTTQTPIEKQTSTKSETIENNELPKESTATTSTNKLLTQNNNVIVEQPSTIVETPSIIAEYNGEEAGFKDQYGTLEEMIELAINDPDDHIVTLYKNVTIEDQIYLSSNDELTINLEFYTIRRINNDNIEDGRIFSVTEGATLYLNVGTISGGKSIANGGAIYVGEGSTVKLRQVTAIDNSAKNGSFAYVENGGELYIYAFNKITGNGTNDSVIHSKGYIRFSQDNDIRNGTVFLDNEGSKDRMMSIYSGGLSGNPILVASAQTPTVLGPYNSSIFETYSGYKIVNIDGSAVLIKDGPEQASYSFSSYSTAVTGSLEEMWNLAKMYKKGTVKLLKDITADIGGSNEVPVTPKWVNNFYQMATGMDANITFDFNGHTLDANMITLLKKADNLNLNRNLGTNFTFLVSQGSTLTLKDSIGGGGLKNVVSAMEYPSVALLAGTLTNKAHLIYDNVTTINCYSGKGAIWANNEHGDIVIKNGAVITNNKNVKSNILKSSSLGNETLNLLVDETSNISAENTNNKLNVGIFADLTRYENAIKLQKMELGEGFVSDVTNYVTITKNDYVQLLKKELCEEVKYIYPDGREKITIFDDAWAYGIKYGGQIIMLKNLTLNNEYITGKNQITLNFNGFIITAIGNNQKLFDIKGEMLFVDNNQATKSIEKLEEQIFDYANMKTTFDDASETLIYYTGKLEGDIIDNPNTGGTSSGETPVEPDNPEIGGEEESGSEEIGGDTGETGGEEEAGGEEIGGDTGETGGEEVEEVDPNNPGTDTPGENTGNEEEENPSYDTIDNRKLVIYKHTDNLSNIGGIKATGYNYVICGNAKILGGQYVTDANLLDGFGTIQNAYIYNCKNRITNSNTIKGNQDLEIINSVIVGNSSYNGTISQYNGSLNIRDSIISGNNVFDSATSNGGGITLKSNNMKLENTYITFNNAKYNGGGIYVEPYYAKSGDKDTLKTIKSIIIENCYINGNTATTGGGLFLSSTDNTSKILNSEIVGNIAKNDENQGNKKIESTGGGLQAENTCISLENVNIFQNKAGQEGGGIYYNGNKFIDVSNISLKNVTIKKNEAKIGGGVYVGQIRMNLIGNINIFDNRRTGLFISKSMQVKVAELESGKIEFATSDMPTREHNVLFAEADTEEKAVKLFEDGIFIPQSYNIITENNNLCLKLLEEIKFSGVLVQYYSYIETISNDKQSQNSNYIDLSVIDTSCDKNGIPLNKAIIPDNGDTADDVGWKYIYFKPNGDLATVITKQELRTIYKDVDINPAEIGTFEELDVFSKNNASYNVDQIWILKNNDYTSINPDDWDIIEYNKDKEFNFEPGQVIRFVCSQKIDNNYRNKAILYDYDISDGYYYLTASINAPKNSSNSINELKNGKTIYVNTYTSGINTDENYSGTGSFRYAFGNANSGTKYGNSIYKNPNLRKITPNKANDGKVNGQIDNSISKTISGISFRLATGLDENGNIIWNEGIDVPKIFNEGEAIGKTTYVNNDLIFKKNGDTYTFTGIQGNGIDMKDLDKFQFTSWNWNNTKKLWSNQFWPMDYVDSYGTDGHDVKFGYGKKYNPISYSSQINCISEGKPLAMSDDSQPHNSYFGMHFNMQFQLPEGYVGPLEYWFFGDDEMWVFLDGKIICDIGGVHGSIGEYVNLWNYIDEGDTNKHELSFYYTERGASGSTCWMQFTAPEVVSITKNPSYSSHNFKKINQHNEVIAGVEFTLYSKDNEAIATVMSDENGMVTFDNLDDEATYFIKETKTASELYMLSNTRYILEKVNGNWIMYDENDSEKNSVTEVVNTLMSQKLPDTGSVDAFALQNVTMIIGIFGCLILIMAIALNKKNKITK